MRYDLFSDCKFTCHKKCYPKVTIECGKEVSPSERTSSERTSSVRTSSVASNNVFGVRLDKLATVNGKVPLVVERLITTIEMHGLYSEGLYRKSGVSISGHYYRSFICVVLQNAQLDYSVVFS